MTVITDLINDSSDADIPDAGHFQHWAATTLQTLRTASSADNNEDKPASLSIRIVDSNESAALNQRYRDKDNATNVLSFGCELPDTLLTQMDEIPLGDLVICATVVNQEAHQQNKSGTAHWAHMVVHGILHLKGYDHVDEQDAERMEALEVRILDTLGFSNPYTSS
ncbi:rRNA maturation RNase YbeY [Pseudohongiella acticola]|jgi:probable rRNA maturation factor|uniref:Endoribonuclease YbeY n=1 Tax=Pseudohongiella acticola TaxID=1524254 RepID=A0A1E8CFB8_9GAMM|nr:rRNA maturation RNase YbeY [Pseudohongiella acticola]OFE11045.1 rRNA maturation RNase YbeY [Pseudohongiella acticola]